MRLCRILLLIVVAHAACDLVASGQPPDGFHLSIAPLSAHFFTRLSDVLQFISELDCYKDGGAAPCSAARLTAPSRIAPVVRRPHPRASGVLCHAADRSTLLSAFLSDDYVSTSLGVNHLTQEQLEQPLVIDEQCFGVASSTFDIMCDYRRRRRRRRRCCCCCSYCCCCVSCGHMCCFDN
jgi:hypothetical protein